MTNAAVATVQARKVQSNHRMASLPRAFPGAYLHVESSVFNAASTFCADYNGGYWDFYRLDNGGFFMALGDDTVKWCNAENYSDGEMSGEAYGIAICLFVYSNLSILYHCKGNEGLAELMADHFHSLREFALDHPESSKIFSLNG